MLKKRFFQQVSLYTLSNFVVAGVPFFLMPIMTRVLNPEDYGMIAMFNVTVAFLTYFVGLNSHSILVVRFFEPETNISQYSSTAILLVLISTLVVISTALLLRPYIEKTISLPFVYLTLAVMVALFTSINKILLVLYQAAGEVVSYGALRLSLALIDMIISLVMVVVLLFAWQGRIVAGFLSYLLIATMAVYILKQRKWLIFSFGFDTAKEILRFGIPIIPHAIGGLLLSMADKLIVNSVIDIYSVGIYVVGAQMGMILGVFVQSVNSAYAPWLMKKLIDITYQEKMKIVIYARIYCAAIFVTALVGGFIAPYVTPLIAGPRFIEASDIVVYFLIGNAFTGMYYMVANFIFFSKKTVFLSYSTVSVGLVSTLICWFMTTSYGLKGASISFMLGQILLFFVTCVLANICFPMPWFSIRKGS